MTYGDFKDLSRHTVSNKILPDEAFNIAKISKYDRYQKGLASMVYKFWIESKQRLQIHLLPVVLLTVK